MGEFGTRQLTRLSLLTMLPGFRKFERMSICPTERSDRSKTSGRLSSAVAGLYVLNSAESALLEQACRTADKAKLLGWTEQQIDALTNLVPSANNARTEHWCGKGI